MTNIIIVGAGFGGLQSALGLEKKFKNNKNISITLIDKRGYHLFTPNLYEAATTEEELVSLSQVKNSISLPLQSILSGKKIHFIKDELGQVDPQKKEITISNKILPYDYLVLALGSQSEFFNIPGAKEFSLTLKDLPDAMRLRNQIEFAVQSHKFDVNKNIVRFVVAGGGYTGLELIAKLKDLADFVAWKNDYPRQKIELEVIESGNTLAGDFDPRLSRDAYNRLQDLGIRVRLSSRISKVERNLIELTDGEKVAYDVLVWATGIRANDTKVNAPMDLDRKGRLPVNAYFQTKNWPNIFVLGDMACILNKAGQPVPSSAQDAVDQGKYFVYTLPYILKNQKPSKIYTPDNHGFIVALGGRWAIMSYKGVYLKGFLAYLADQFAHFDYYRGIVGFWKALKWALFQVEIYRRND